jgi:hypothetical protein
MPRLPKGFSAACRGLPGVLLFCALAITTAAAADKEKPTMKQATGTFTVSLQPMQDPDAVPDPRWGACVWTSITSAVWWPMRMGRC